MPKNQMTKILEDPLKHESMVHGYGGVLAGLGARIIYEMKISVPRWLSLMNDFVTDARNGAQTENQKDRTSMRGNLTKEFSRPQMTWKVFIKLLRFLQIVKFQLTITAYHATGKVSQHHSKVINLGGRLELGEFLRNVDTMDEADLADYAEVAEEVLKNARSGQASLPLGTTLPEPSPQTQEANAWTEQHGDAIAAGQTDMFEQEAEREMAAKSNPYDSIQ